MAETRDLREDPRLYVVFVDSLGDDDVENNTDFIRDEVYDGRVDVGHPYVTPKVLGEMYTGKSPGKHGLPSISRYDQPSRTRPAAPTIPEIAAEDDTHENVCSYWLPFIAPPEASPQGTYWAASDSMGQQVFAPSDAQPLLTLAGPAGDISNPDVDGDVIWNLRKDHVTSTFAQARSIAHSQDFDVVFISCRVLDEYCHHRYSDVGEGFDRTDRELMLAEVIDHEIERLAETGEVLVFGDHGATELDHVFKINRWLADEEFLSVDVDVAFRDEAIEKGVLDEPDGPGEVHMVGGPHVTVDEEASVAIGDDPFSGGITLLDGATEDQVEAMLDALESTPYVDGTFWSRDEWEGDLIHEAPDIYAERAVGTFISGNLAAEMGGAEITRSGVHHPTAAWGSTLDIDAPDVIGPQDLFGIVLDFLGIDAPEEEPDRQYGATTDEETEAVARERLRDLGYL